ncbi:MULTISPECIES: cytochrome C oxidase subunit IV family protein [unclassified Acidovorax]|uniref:cytochrome C oxidase subunit IV family protein n=1 Tax=unclassified Acidovorax TaxID=2684926 RepID=UPI001C46F264|nr:MULTISPECIES: cytochrome C oxidase subunit IV family protein [unclassified Acidovorax]MBV7459769.1 cytochrome C oxidase subunit IV family protein [Acidovorax sp. sif0632]MBV7464794.1 cytochrome C oxidase subunit IV family protein [Acidovorax sp. sif0613]
MTRLFHRIDALWLALLAATALTTWLGERAGAQGLGTGAAVLVLALAAAKGCLIILDYMELRHAPALWRRLLLGWLAAVVLLVLAATLWPR